MFTVSSTHRFLQVQQFGFVTLEPLLCRGGCLSCIIVTWWSGSVEI